MITAADGAAGGIMAGVRATGIMAASQIMAGVTEAAGMAVVAAAGMAADDAGFGKAPIEQGLAAAITRKGGCSREPNGASHHSGRHRGNSPGFRALHVEAITPGKHTDLLDERAPIVVASAPELACMMHGRHVAVNTLHWRRSHQGVNLHRANRGRGGSP